MDKSQVHISKFLSLILRHKPETIGLELDNSGWANVSELLAKAEEHNRQISMKELITVVAENDKQRFIFNSDRSKIRANQGHSLSIELDLKPVKPPEILYHGTATRFIDSIRTQGLIKGRRQHVHLSSDIETARKVGDRHGKPVILAVLTDKMHDGNHQFFLSDNKVWLTDYVPVEYILFP
ncbi:RNA 2'-phosphotransferase [Synechococcus sp. PCC 7336]|uniref:RNA 2'-phosphotransferase n=1 Tax=Synechococcus sp. PCC 7336 TaxID=195250 RepID=UPI000370B25C|nr:RNA 2'-phosphotransferase [Synechococcus sp. PCC 7336]